jgi:hypothetical protein
MAGMRIMQEQLSAANGKRFGVGAFARGAGSYEVLLKRFGFIACDRCRIGLLERALRANGKRLDVIAFARGAGSYEVRSGGGGAVSEGDF